MRTLRQLCAAATILAATAGLAAAQDQDELHPRPAEHSHEKKAPDPSVESLLDVGDLWRIARRKPAAEEPPRKFAVATPSIGSKPSTGFNAGFSGNVAFYAGDPETTHISTLSGGLKVSQKKQVLSGIRFATFTKDDRWFIQSDNRLSWTSANTFGLGGQTLPSDAENVKYDFFHFYESAYRRVRPGLFAGLGLDVSDHANVRPGPDAPPAQDTPGYDEYNQAHGFDQQKQTSSGASFGLLFDSRDNAINAHRGELASVVYRTFFEGFLGGDSTWQELNVDMRKYEKLDAGARQRLAFWFLGDFVTGGIAPYFDLPATATQEPRSGRGYAEGRYRGEKLVYGEMEYRATLTGNGLFGMVLFANATSVANSATNEKLFDSIAPGAGFGFRFLLNKRSRTNLCTDWGWGKQGSRGFYLSIQEAF